MSYETQLYLAVIGFPLVSFIAKATLLWLDKRDMDRRFPVHPGLDRNGQEV